MNKQCRIEAIIHNRHRDVRVLNNLLATIAGTKNLERIFILSAVSPLPDEHYSLKLENVARRYNADISWVNLSPYITLNEIIAQLNPTSLLFLADTSVELKKNTISLLAEVINVHKGLAGVNPIFFNSWDADACVLHLGTVTDSQGQLHYLHEGIGKDSPLVSRTRNFALAHQAAFLTRVERIQAAGLFHAEAEEMAFLELCQRMGRNGHFSTISAASAVLKDEFASWKQCGLWNSLLWRDKLPLEPPPASWHTHVLADGLACGLTDWLWPHCPDLPSGPQSKFFAWRHDPCPRTLLTYVGALEQELMPVAVDLARSLPASLPRQLAFYEHLAPRLQAFAREHGLDTVSACAEKWLKSSRTFRHRELRPGITALLKSGIYNASLDRCPAIYDAWLETSPRASVPRLEPGKDWPRIALAMPVYNPPLPFLREAIHSIKSQSYPHWELCIADDGSDDAAVRLFLEAEAAADARLKIIFRQENGHICRATNSALELVSSPWTAFMDNDDVLHPEALAHVAQCAAANPELGLIYTDEDHLDAHSCRRNPHFATSWDHFHLPAHLCAYRTSLLQDLGGLRPGLEGCQDTDLAIRAREKLRPKQFAHIPHVLYHWRVHGGSTAAHIGAKPYVLDNHKKMHMQWAERHHLPGVPVCRGHKLGFSVAHHIPQNFRAALVFPCQRRDLSPQLMQLAVALSEQIALTTLYLPEGEKMPRPTVMCPHTAYWQSIVAPALAQLTVDAVLFVHPALRPAPGCLPAQLLLQATLPCYSIIGGMIYSQGRLLNGGLYPDITGAPFPLLRGMTDEALAVYNWGRFATPHPALGLSWMCYAISAKALKHLPVVPDNAFSSTIMALKLHAKGENIIISPFGRWELSGESGEATLPEEVADFLEKWGGEVRGCGLRHPNMRAAPDYDWTLIW